MDWKQGITLVFYLTGVKSHGLYIFAFQWPLAMKLI